MSLLLPLPLRGLLRLAALTLLAAPAAALAALTWTAPDLTAKLAPGQTTLATRFEFKNTGRETVRITEVRTTCGCAGGRTDLTSYAPGASGVFTVDFAALGAVGVVERHLFVLTDEPGAQPYPVSLRIEIPEWFALTPRLLVWDLNAPPAPKTARLTLDPAAKAEILRVTSSVPTLTTRLVPGPEPDTRLVEITPAATDTPVRAVVSVVVRLPSSEEITKTIHVRVR